jgi:hypothetical protein
MTAGLKVGRLTWFRRGGLTGSGGSGVGDLRGREVPGWRGYASVFAGSAFDDDRSSNRGPVPKADGVAICHPDAAPALAAGPEL